MKPTIPPTGEIPLCTSDVALHKPSNVIPLFGTKARQLAADSCANLADLLPLWANSSLAGAEAERVQRHVATCAACQAEVSAITALLAEIGADAGDGPAHEDAYWTALTADILAATAAVPQAPETKAPWSVSQPVMRSNAATAARQRRWWHLSAVAGSAVAAAAALALVVAKPWTPELRPVATAATGDHGANWYELPVLPLDDDFAAGDDDPMGTVDDLDDNELELVDAVLTDDGV